MTVFITITATTAARLRGLTAPGHALDPPELADGLTYILPLEVLNDPAHADALRAFQFGRIDTLNPTRTLTRTETKTDDTYTRLNLSDASLQREVLEAEFKQYDENGDPVVRVR